MAAAAGTSHPSTPVASSSRSNEGTSTSSITGSSSTSSGGGDSLVRSAAKALAWRVFSTTATLALAVAVFGGERVPLRDALTFGGAEFTLKLLLYCTHERLWAAAAGAGDS